MGFRIGTVAAFLVGMAWSGWDAWKYPIRKLWGESWLKPTLFSVPVVSGVAVLVGLITGLALQTMRWLTRNKSAK
jgi:hypothetical protein